MKQTPIRRLRNVVSCGVGGSGQRGECNLIRGVNTSYSWDQPGSGLLGAEGRCGQTCVANLLKNTRPSVHVSPESLVSNGA